MKPAQQKIEAYGYKYNNRDQRIVWRKVFPSDEALNKWADKSNATVIGTRKIGPSDPGYSNPKYMKEDYRHGATADELEIGDQVIITGKNVNFNGKVGVIDSFGSQKAFVVVNLDGIGKRSFHTSDVQGFVEDEYEDENEAEDEFYVSFYDEDTHQYWVGKVSKDNDARGKWVESSYKGRPDYRWGQRYMSYLSPEEVMSWIKKDYGRSYDDISGPLNYDELQHQIEQYMGAKLTESPATEFSLLSSLLSPKLNENRIGDRAPKFKIKSSDGQFMLHCCGKKVMTLSHEDWMDLVDAVKNRTTGNFGGYLLKQKGDSYSILDSTGDEVAYITASEMDDLISKSTGMVKEAVEYTDFKDWKQAVLNSYPAQAKRIKFKGRMEGNKMTISAEIPGEDRSYGVWDEDRGNGVVLSEQAYDFEGGAADQDPGEYDQEGDMALVQLRTIMSAAQELSEMLQADDNLPEWVQNKITLAEDYITTVRDYLMAK